MDVKTSFSPVEETSKIASYIVLGISISVLIGWFSGISYLQNFLGGWQEMAISTAFCFILCAAALLAEVYMPSFLKKDNNIRLKKGIEIFSYIIPLFIITVSFFKIAEYIMGWKVGIDSHFILRANELPVHMAPTTALNFLLLGSAFLIPKSKRFSTLFQYLILLCVLNSWLGFSHYLYGGKALLPFFTKMAAHTAFSFLVLSIGMLCLRKDDGLLALCLSDTSGGLMARRLVPAALIIPIILGWLGLQGIKADFFGEEGCISVIALSNILVFGALIWANALLLHRSDLEGKTTEQKLLASLKEISDLKAALDEHAIVAITNPQGKITYVNDKFCSISKYSREELIGQDHRIINSGHHSKEFIRDLWTTIAHAKVWKGEICNRAKDGSFYWVDTTIVPFINEEGKPYQYVAIRADITERKRAEQELRASLKETNNLKTALDEHAIVAITNPQGKITYVNDKFCSISKYSREELIGQDHRIINSGHHSKEFIRDLWTTIAHAKVWKGEICNRAKDGSFYWVDTTIVPFINEEGKPHQYVAIRADITERKRTEYKLQTQLERLSLLQQITRAIGERQDMQSIFQVVIRSLEEHLPIDFCCICVYDDISQALTVTRVGIQSQPLALELALTEQANVDIDGNGLAECINGKLVYEPNIEKIKYAFPQRLAKGGLNSMVIAPLQIESKVFGVLVAARKEINAFSSGECEFLYQLCKHVALASNHAQLYNELQKAYDDLRLTQQNAMQQERLRALGQMASGIAHDINNAISPITLYTSSLLSKEPNLSAHARNYLETIQQAIGDVAATVSRMSEFYRQRETQLTLAEVQLNTLVQQVVEITRAKWSNIPQEKGLTIKMVTELDSALPPVMAVESEIREALVNLIFNAVDAMPEGGVLTLRTKVKEGEKIGDLSPLKHVHIEVCDTGIGMDEHTQHHCLEPFFTTKGERGTGLGLAMVYGIAQRNSAQIKIESHLGKGTKISMIFPLFTGLRIDKEEPDFDKTTLSRLSILIVDDDPLVLKSLRDALETEGHFITTASGGQAAIDAFHAAMGRNKPFAAVITDLGMPYVDGRKVATAIKMASPLMPVILLTGWGQRLVAEGDIPEYVDYVLNKPPNLRELLQTLNKAVKGNSVEKDLVNR